MDSDTPLHQLVVPQVANYCWRAFQVRTLGDFAQYIETHKLIKVPGVPWLFRFADEPYGPKQRHRSGDGYHGLLGVGKGSWQTLLLALDQINFPWRNHIVNRVTYKPEIQ